MASRRSRMRFFGLFVPLPALALRTLNLPFLDSWKPLVTTFLAFQTHWLSWLLHPYPQHHNNMMLSFLSTPEASFSSPPARPVKDVVQYGSGRTTLKSEAVELAQPCCKPLNRMGLRAFGHLSSFSLTSVKEPFELRT